MYPPSTRDHDGTDDDRTRHPATEVDLTAEMTAYARRLGPDTGYLPPTEADREGVAAGVGLLLDGDLTAAGRRLSTLDLTLRTVVDRGSGRRFAEVADRTERAASPRGWGRVYVDLDHRARWSVQVPHPASDQYTEVLGARVLRGSPGGVLVVAGAHRQAGEDGSADVAHQPGSIFHAVCAELVRRGLPGIQVHGFARSSAPHHDVIASTSAARTAGPEALLLADALRERGFRVCRAWRGKCPLAGVTNAQNRTAADARVPFLHVEFAPPLRADGAPNDRATAAVTELTRTWAAAG
ncbi:hypothetical protein ACIPEL_37195 [Streptomyces griseoviridis]